MIQNLTNEQFAPFNDNEVTGVGATYLMEFETMSKEKRYVIPVILESSARGVVFSLRVAATGEGNPKQGTVQLDAGQWRVNVYRQDSIENLDPNDEVVDGLVYQTMAHVETPTGSEASNQYDSTDIKVYYDG